MTRSRCQPLRNSCKTKLQRLSLQKLVEECLPTSVALLTWGWIPPEWLLKDRQRDHYQITVELISLEPGSNGSVHWRGMIFSRRFRILTFMISSIGSKSNRFWNWQRFVILKLRILFFHRKRHLRLTFRMKAFCSWIKTLQICSDWYIRDILTRRKVSQLEYDRVTVIVLPSHLFRPCCPVWKVSQRRIRSLSKSSVWQSSRPTNRYEWLAAPKQS